MLLTTDGDSRYRTVFFDESFMVHDDHSDRYRAIEHPSFQWSGRLHKEENGRLTLTDAHGSDWLHRM